MSNEQTLPKELNQNWEFGTKSNNSGCTKAKDTDEKVKSVLHYVKEIADFIIGSHTALSMFISSSEEWKTSRHELIKHFEILEKNLKESSDTFTRYTDIIDMADKGATLATAIPHPQVSIAAKIVSAFTSLFSIFLTKSNENNIKDSNEIITAMFKDTDASTEVYMYGLQCSQQFEETTKLIKKFHSKAEEHKLFATENREIAKFIQGVLEYKPAHRIFYKKLHKCFQELLQTATSSDARRLCEPFLLYPSTAVDVVEYLDWRFHYEDFNSESVRHELEQIHQMIQDKDSSTLRVLVQRIQNCIRILRDELTFVERCLKDVSLFDVSPDQSATKDSLKFSN